MALAIPSPEVPSIAFRFHSEYAYATRSLPYSNPTKSFRAPLICRNNDNFRRFRGCTSRIDCEVRVLDTDQSAAFNILFSAPLKQGVSSSPSAKSKEEQEKQNYYVNKGHAIRTLRQEFRELFYREPSFDIYRDDIVFKDPLNTFTGIENYKSIFSALRFQGRIFFKSLWVEIASVWQPAESTIILRWTIHGIPRLPWESHGQFDGVSEYKLDKNGKIREHRVDDIVLRSPPKFGVVALEELIQSLGCLSIPKATCFELSSSSSSSMSLMSLVKLKLALVKFPLAGILGLVGYPIQKHQRGHVSQQHYGTL